MKKSSFAQYINNKRARLYIISKISDGNSVHLLPLHLMYYKIELTELPLKLRILRKHRSYAKYAENLYVSPEFLINWPLWSQEKKDGAKQYFLCTRIMSKRFYFEQ